MNKLNEMDIASLSEEEVEKLKQYESKMNQNSGGKELYLLALTK